MAQTRPIGLCQARKAVSADTEWVKLKASLLANGTPTTLQAAIKARDKLERKKEPVYPGSFYVNDFTEPLCLFVLNSAET
jgi:hypothetical protein